LSSIPVLKYLFGSKDHTITDDELVFLVVPHIVRTQVLDQANLREVDTGVGQTSIDLRRVPTDAPNSANATPVSYGTPEAASIVRGSAVVRPGVGVVPGQSAMAAAPAALAQLDASADANGQTAAAAVAGRAPVTPSTVPAAVPTRTLNFMFSPMAGPVTSGSTFQIPVVLMGGTDVTSVPLQVQYDPAKLALVNVGPGDLLSRESQVVHREDGAGGVNIVTSLPPGAAGVSGAGVVCVLSFQAKAPGETIVSMKSAAAVNSAQQQIKAQGGQINIVVK